MKELNTEPFVIIKNLTICISNPKVLHFNFNCITRTLFTSITLITLMLQEAMRS